MLRTKYVSLIVAGFLAVMATGCIVDVEPDRATNPVGTEHTVTVELRDFTETEQIAVCEAVIEILEDAIGGEPAPEDFCEEIIGLPRVTDHTPVYFEIVSGPNTGLNSDTDGVCLPSCDDLGVREVSWTYPSNGQAGTDVIDVCVDFFDYILPPVMDEFQSEVGTTQSMDDFEEMLLDALNEALGTDFESEDDIACSTVTKTWVDRNDRPNIGAGLSGLFQGQPTALPTAPAPVATAPNQGIRPPNTGDAGLR